MRLAHGLCLLLVIAAPAGAQESRAAREARLRDASLRAVQFIERDVGWAVGDEGVILHTIDGGKTWERKPTGLRASLRSVCFQSPFVGWVAGREELPGGGSVGVLLFTRDGGETWQQLLGGTLPGLNQVRFVSQATGFLLADGAEQYPSGLFRTDDGGRSWEPVSGPRTPGWLAGDFQDGKTGVLAGCWSRLATLKQGELHTAADLRLLGGRHLHALQVLPRRLLAAGEGGLLLTSGSAGASWGFAETKLPAEVLACLDLQAMHAVGTQVWAVGRPGSVLLHSADSGSTWRLLKTGQPLPLHGVFFFNERQGWAVGAAGTILASSDGGASWQVQRQGGKRAACLCVDAHARDVPADTLAVLGGSEGYLTAALRVVAPEPGSAAPTCAQEPQRVAAAVRSAGGLSGETLWAFPLPQYLEQASHEQVLAYWDRLHAGQARRELVRQLVLTLRIWRPSVVLTQQPAGSTVGGLVAQALADTAVRAAADAKEFPEQLEQLSLQTWQVSRVFARRDGGDAAVVQDNHEPRDLLGATATEHAALATLALTGDINAAPGRRGYDLLPATATSGATPRHWLTGVNIDEGDARRTLLPAPAAAALVQAIRARRNLVAVAERLDDQGQALTRLTSLLQQAGDEAAVTGFAVASIYARRGQWLLAQDACQLLVEHCPTHPLAAEACRWLIQHGSSGEARLRQLPQRGSLAEMTVAPQPPARDKVPGKVDAEARSGLKLLEYSVRGQPQQAAVTHDPLGLNQEMGKRLAGFGPLYATDVPTQFCLQAAQRRLGKEGAAREWYARCHKLTAPGPWHSAAAAELWLATGAGSAPPRLGRCRLTETRPHLDGNVDDACWHGQAPLRLDNASGDTAGDYPTDALFAYDQEFLYVALRCRHPQGHQVPPVTARGRDADVEAYDRVSLLFDVERDYATAYHLQVDQRGCVRDDCWGDLTWNPRWFVAVKSDAQAWHLEAALPLAELTGARVPLGSAWAFNVVRILPGRGVQAWSLPADVRPRLEGMTLLHFQQAPERATPPMQTP